MASYARGEINVTTAAATNTVSETGVGFTPTWILFYWNGRTAATDGEGGATAIAGVGMTSGTANRFALSIFDNDGQATTDTGVRQNVAACIIECATGGAAGGEMDLQSFDADGFTLVIDSQFTNDLRVGYICGNDANAFVGTWTPAGTGSQSETGVGFQPEMVLGTATRLNVETTTGTSNAIFTLGAYDGTNQWTVATGASDGDATTATGRYGNGDDFTFIFNTAVTAVNATTAMTSLDSDGFTATITTLAHNIGYLCLAGGEYAVGDRLTATNTTAFTESGLSFRPKLTLFASHGTTESAADTPSTDAAVLSIGAAMTDTSRHAMAYSSDGGVGTSEVYTANQTEACYVHPDLADGSDGLMDFVSNQARSWTAVMDDADTTGSFLGYVSFGEPHVGITVTALSDVQ